MFLATNYKNYLSSGQVSREIDQEIVKSNAIKDKISS